MQKEPEKEIARGPLLRANLNFNLDVLKVMQQCPHCLKHFNTARGLKIHDALSLKCRAIRATKIQDHHDSDSESFSSSESSSGSDTPLFPTRNRFLNFFKLYRQRGLFQRPLHRSETRTSLESVSSSSQSQAEADVPTGSGPYVERHPSPGSTFGRGDTILDDIDKSDQFAKQRQENVYYPFLSKEDWEVAAWLIQSGLSMSEIDKFLKLVFVS